MKGWMIGVMRSDKQGINSNDDGVITFVENGITVDSTSGPSGWIQVPKAIS